MQFGVTCFLTDRDMAPADLARAAEERGFPSLYLPEHTHLPVRADNPPALVEGVRLDDYRRSLDPFVALATAASVTRRIRLGTGMVLAAQHDPIVLAKQVATLDHLSGGRVDLGIGLRVEPRGGGRPRRRRSPTDGPSPGSTCCACGPCGPGRPGRVPRAVRRPRPVLERPKPVQRPRVPILLGGGATPKVFAAIAEYADGWMPIGGSGLAEALPQLRRAVEAAGRDPAGSGWSRSAPCPRTAKLEHFARLGIDEVVLRVPAGTADEMLAVLDAQPRFVDRFGGAGG